jgi:hypothetical protein
LEPGTRTCRGGPGPSPSPRPGRLARRGGGGNGGAAIAERRRRRPCGRRHDVDDYRPRGIYIPAYRPARPPTLCHRRQRAEAAGDAEERSRYFFTFLSTSRRSTARRRPECRSCTPGVVASRRPCGARPRAPARGSPRRNRPVKGSTYLSYTLSGPGLNELVGR